MKIKNAEKTINTFFIVEVVFATLGIISTIAYYIYEHMSVTIDFEMLRISFYSFLFAIILFVISAYAKSVFMFILGLFPFGLCFLGAFASFTIKFSFDGTYKTCLSLFLIVLFIVIIVFAFIFKRKKLLELENEQRKNALELEINQCFSECEKDYTLRNLMAHSAIINRNIQLYENLPINANEKERITKYKNKLLNDKQKYIEKTILNHYKIICDHIETRQVHLSKKIYSASQNLKDSISRFANQFDEKNQKLSSMILEKTNFIITFTEKYIDAYNSDTKYNLDDMKGQDFEKYCANLLIAYGFVNVRVTRGSGDQGVDVIGTYNNLKYAIQCKRYSHKLGNTPIQEVAAGKNYYNCQRALVITNNFFTDGAVELAKANNVELWDRDQLMQLIYYTDNQWNKLMEEIKIDFQETQNIRDGSVC